MRPQCLRPENRSPRLESQYRRTCRALLTRDYHGARTSSRRGPRLGFWWWSRPAGTVSGCTARQGVKAPLSQAEETVCPVGPPRLAASWWSTALTVFRKESIELFRDRRTVLVSLAVPLVLFPLLVVLGLAGTEDRPGDGMHRVAVTGAVPDELLLLISGSDKRFVIETATNQDAVDEALDAGSADVGLVGSVGHAAEGSGQAADSETPPLLVVVRYDNRTPRSSGAAAALQPLVAHFARIRSTERVRALGFEPESLSPVTLEVQPLYTEAVATGYLALGFLLPVLALVAGALAPLASAVDLGAGEKERGTLETLLGTSASRSALVVGKYLAVLVLGLIGVAAFFAGAGAALWASSRMVETALMLPDLTGAALLLMGVLVVAAAALCSAIELCISLWAPSAKAAQAYALPVLILASAAGYGATAVGYPADAPWSAAVPLLNVAVGLRAAAAHTALLPSGWLIATVGVLGGLVCGLLAVATVVCGRESVLRRR
ncbi:MAG: ABC transporter permease [Spirochaetaceae bacterium]|nr:MAG: ABC transporter permease [Spirochaetaceae bacterium]